MITSTDTKELYTALGRAQAVMEGADKSSTNPFFHSRYADLAEVWNTIRKPLTDNGLGILQSIDSEANMFVGKVPIRHRETGAVTGERDAMYIWLVITTRLCHTSGQFVENIICLPVEADPQSLGKVTTYIRRYAIMALCGVAPEDDDGEAAAGRQAPAPVRTAQMATRPAPKMAVPSETVKQAMVDHLAKEAQAAQDAHMADLIADAEDDAPVPRQEAAVATPEPPVAPGGPQDWNTLTAEAYKQRKLSPAQLLTLAKVNRHEDIKDISVLWAKVLAQPVQQQMAGAK